MRRIGILTAGGDTPALNATLYGAVARANALRIEVCGLMNGFAGLLDPKVPHVRLNPLFSTIPELDPTQGGTLLGASRTYIDPNDSQAMHDVTGRLRQLGIEGLVCIGGDGTLNGMSALSEIYPCVLAPKTIDNDLGLNYIDEPNDWGGGEPQGTGRPAARAASRRDEITLEEIVNYATPGYATSVYVVAQSIQRIRTTAESHRRIAIVEVMGRQSGWIALGSAYGQPDVVLIPEVPLDEAHFVERVRELYDLQNHVVIAIGEGMVDAEGCRLGDVSRSVDPAGNVKFSGAGEALCDLLSARLGDQFFRRQRWHEDAKSAIFTRKVGHTQRGGRPILFDRFYATQLGGKAIDLLVTGQNNTIATLQWSESRGFFLDSLPANKLRDARRVIHPRLVHRSLYDPHRFQPSKLGVEYLLPIFTDAIGADDVEFLREDLFNPGNLSTRYQSVNIDVRKRMEFLTGGPE